VSLPLLNLPVNPTDPYADDVKYYEDDELTPIEIAQQAENPVPTTPTVAPDPPEVTLPQTAPYDDNNQPVDFPDYGYVSDSYLDDKYGSTDCDLVIQTFDGDSVCESDYGFWDTFWDIVDFASPLSYVVMALGAVALCLFLAIALAETYSNVIEKLEQYVWGPLRTRAACQRRAIEALDQARTAYAVLNEVRWIGANVRSLADRLKSRRKAQNLILGWESVEREVGTIDRTMAVLLEAGVPRRLTMVTIINFEKECQAVTDAVSSVAGTVDTIGRQCIGLDDVVRSFVSNPDAYATLASKYVLRPDAVPIPLPSVRLFGVVSIPRKVLSIGRR
jgi:hypothetical protein